MIAEVIARALQRAVLLACLCVSFGDPTALCETPSHFPKAVPIAEVLTIGGSGSTSSIYDSYLLREGSAWDSAEALVLDGTRSSVEIRFSSDSEIRYLILQGDNNDSYLVEARFEPDRWEVIWGVNPDPSGEGLRTRWIKLDATIVTDRLRVRPGVGDAAFSVGGIIALSEEPTPWPPTLVFSDDQPAPDNWSELTQNRMDAIKLLLAALGLPLLVWLARPSHSAERKWANTAWAVIALLCLAGWWNLFRFHFPSFVHTWEVFHYYMGAKYVNEIGYTKLYECATAADVEDGIQIRANNSIRDLRTNALVSPSGIVADQSSCTEQFSPKRWEHFKEDVRWFRTRMSPGRWSDLKRDHGFNATPVWIIAGKLFSSFGSISENFAQTLAAIDVVLLVVMWLTVWWAFGWRVAGVALVFWGTNFPARFFWTGGSFLRHDWLVYLVLSICLLKKERPAWAGGLLAYAAMLRVFPGFVALGLIAKVVVNMFRTRSLKITPEQWRFFLGAGLAVLIAVPLSVGVSGRSGIWSEFIENSQKHLETPLTNNMGLRTVLSYSESTRARALKDPINVDPFGPWKEAKRDLFEQRLPWFFLLVGAFIVLLAVAVRDHPDWVALALGVGLIPFAAELTCYYYSFLLIYGLLWHLKPTSGYLLIGFSLVSCVMPQMWTWYDELFTWMSVVALVLVTTITALHLRSEGEKTALASNS